MHRLLARGSEPVSSTLQVVCNGEGGCVLNKQTQIVSSTLQVVCNGEGGCVLNKQTQIFMCDKECFYSPCWVSHSTRMPNLPVGYA